jgi:hypothetical protein
MPNRRDRRSQQQQHSSSPTAITMTANNVPSMRASDDPRNQPGGPKPAKTLLEIAAERHQAIQSHILPAGATLKESNVVSVTIDDDGNVRTLDGSPLPAGLAGKVGEGGKVVVAEEGGKAQEGGKEEEGDAKDEIPPLMDTLLLSLPLSAVHFTLAVLAMHQFALELKFGVLARETVLRAFPTLTLLVHLFRGHLLKVDIVGGSVERRRVLVALRSLVYLVVANVAGCYLLTLTNGRGYYAAVKHAPGVGTLWVWAVLEMGLVGAVGGVTGPAVFAWWHGYGF